MVTPLEGPEFGMVRLSGKPDSLLLVKQGSPFAPFRKGRSRESLLYSKWNRGALAPGSGPPLREVFIVTAKPDKYNSSKAVQGGKAGRSPSTRYDKKHDAPAGKAPGGGWRNGKGPTKYGKGS